MTIIYNLDTAIDCISLILIHLLTPSLGPGPPQSPPLLPSLIFSHVSPKAPVLPPPALTLVHPLALLPGSSLTPPPVPPLVFPLWTCVRVCLFVCVCVHDQNKIVPRKLPTVSSPDGPEEPSKVCTPRDGTKAVNKMTDSISHDLS